MKVSRKNFIHTSTKVLTGALLFHSYIPKLYPQEVPKKPSSKKKRSSAIIIGAGISGLYSAYLLQEAGYSVTILEASNRLGGRILTIKDEPTGFYAELGAEFISTKHKHVIQLCKQLSIPLEQVQIQPNLCINSKPTESKFEYSSTTLEILNKLFEIYKKMNSEQKKQLDQLSLFNYLKYQGVTKDELILLDLHYSAFTGKSLRFLSAVRGILSLYQLLDAQFEFYKIKNGTYSIIDKLEQKLKKANISLKDPVKKINQSGKDVEVITESGASFKADICICTLPGNLLDKIQWSPELPKQKKMAGIKLVYSRISKKVSFWKDCLWLNDDFFTISNSNFRLLYIIGEDIQKKRGLLSGISLGESSEIFYKENLDYSKKIIELSLQNYDIFKQNQISSLNFKVWHHEPYFSGGSSIYFPGTYNVMANLKEPFDKVYFAGEHLSNDSGNMNSALVSAKDAVEMVV